MPDAKKLLAMQEDVWLDNQGALLLVISTQAGEKLDEFKLDSIPVWGGMIAADEKLYISSKDGKIRCFGK
jgi:hypothetical protein